MMTLVNHVLIKKASKRVLDKMKAYKAELLPGGKLWNPDPDTRKALEKVRPTNDLCERILGLNDWIQKRTPNISQQKVSGMVEVLKKTQPCPGSGSRTQISRTKQ